jgi:hypothetical protein
VNTISYKQALLNVLNWGAEHDEEFRLCLVDTLRMTDKEFESTFNQTKESYIKGEE